MKRFSSTPLLSFDHPARWFLLALVVDGMATSGWSLFYNLYYLAQGYDRQFLGLLNAMPSAAALVVGVPMGMLSDRIGRKRAMLSGLMLGILAMVVQTIASQPALILLGAFLGGTFGMLFYLSQAPFMLSASNNKNRDLLFSLSFAMLCPATHIALKPRF